MTYPPGAWQPPEPPPVGDPVYVEQPYPYPGYGVPWTAQYPAAWPAPPEPPAARTTPPLIGYALLAGAVVVIAAAFMPWADVFGVSVNGTDGTGDGNWTLFLGALVGVMGIVIALQRGRAWASIIACVAAAFVVATAVKDVADVNGFANANGLDPSAVTVGTGLWLTLLAGLFATGFAVAGLVNRGSARD